jgi:hypothetical protein
MAQAQKVRDEWQINRLTQLAGRREQRGHDFQRSARCKACGAPTISALSSRG